MTTKTRKHDLRTRVTQSTLDQVRRYAAAQKLTSYAAAERLVMLGLETLSNATGIDAVIQQTLDCLIAKVDLLSGLTDRTLFSATVAYVYARHVAIDALDGTQRQALDQALTRSAESAYQRQLAKVGGDHASA